MKKSTKARILETGAQIIHLKGFNHTGIQEILDAVSVPKGSFYNYFKSKDDFGLQVIDFFVAHFDQLAENFLGNRSLPPLERIRGLLDNFISFYRSKDYCYGCPVGNLAQELGDISPEFRDKLRYAMDRMVGSYERVLEEAKSMGDLPQDFDAHEAAHFIVSSWEGALIRIKIVKGPEPLENHRRFIFDYILKK